MEEKEKSFFDYAYSEHETGFPKKLTWIVMYEDINRQSVIPFNIFDHYSFMNDLIRIKKECKEDFDLFAEKVDRSLHYYYGSKSEWEVIVTSWPPYIDGEELDRLNKERADRLEKGWKFYRTDVRLDVGAKIDVLTQVKLNWSIFIHYLWDNRKLIKAKKII